MKFIKSVSLHYTKLVIGISAGAVLPNRRLRLTNGAIHPNDTNLGRIDRCILYAEFRERNNTKLREFHEAFWSTPRALKWFDAFSNRFSEHYLKDNALLIASIEALLQDEDLGINQVCELGTGTGDAIHYFSQQLPRESLQYLGIDINAKQIERNQQFYAKSAVNFEVMTIQEWSQQRLTTPTLIFAFGGVMEYLPRADVELLYQRLAETTPSAIALLETLKVDVDTPSNDSIVFGSELTLSHPHMDLLKKAGFSIIHERQVHQLGNDMLEIVAVKR